MQHRVGLTAIFASRRGAAALGLAVAFLVISSFAWSVFRGTKAVNAAASASARSASPASFFDEYPPGAIVYDEIEPYGQDVDKDGIATTEEGAVDVDGDGRFTEVEMAAFEMTCYIVWAEDVGAPQTMFDGRVCAAACIFVQGFGRICVGQSDASVNCIAGASGSCTGTVPCGPPCVCPM